MPPPEVTPLAQGELGEADARELQALKEQIVQRAGFYCHGYKEKCLRRRLAVRMRARGIHRYADYATLLQSDPGEYDRLLAALTINTSKFFRNPEVWDALCTHVVPSLFAVRGTTVRLWSAGAAAGEEAYSLAILLLEYARAHRLEARLKRCEVLATDIDRQSLEIARQGEYPGSAFSEMPAALRDRWLEGPRRNRVPPAARRLVRFEEADLLTEPLREPKHLIVCRNVIIYFEREMQENLFTRFRHALVPGGYLVLGKVETLYGRAGSWFRVVAPRERIYQRI
ncbi:MAG: protein-glutamate O-methyltransferase CheR [Gemmatimonadetes bacterium]|nr:protein-glutamate O-methyltransferase CheR [Gemmatimonadota bacterium]